MTITRRQLLGAGLGLAGAGLLGACSDSPTGITGMSMVLFEYSGASGFELCDQICQANVTRPSLTATTNFDLTANHELAISVISWDMAAATVPTGWNARTTR